MSKSLQIFHNWKKKKVKLTCSRQSRTMKNIMASLVSVPLIEFRGPSNNRLSFFIPLSSAVIRTVWSSRNCSSTPWCLHNFTPFIQDTDPGFSVFGCQGGIVVSWSASLFPQETFGVWAADVDIHGLMRVWNLVQMDHRCNSGLSWQQRQYEFTAGKVNLVLKMHYSFC